MKPFNRVVISAAIAAACVAFAAPALAGVTFYSNEDLGGKSFSTSKNVRDLERTGLGQRVRSLAVDAGRWQICDDSSFGGKCAVVGPGEYKSLPVMGIDRVVSVRAAEGS